MKVFFALALTAIIVAPGFAGAAECAWPAWQNYRQAMLSSDGRVIDRSSEQLITTSEGQSYGLFFALLGNDRESFAKVLRWTQDNLAGGDLNRQLPAWQWGRDKAGHWQVLDSNNATDADLWIAYSLLEAGRLWHQPDLPDIGSKPALAQCCTKPAQASGPGPDAVTRRRRVRQSPKGGA